MNELGTERARRRALEPRVNPLGAVGAAMVVSAALTLEASSDAATMTAKTVPGTDSGTAYAGTSATGNAGLRYACGVIVSALD